MSDAISNPRLFTTPENLPPSQSVRRQIFLPAATEWLGLFNGAFSLLCNEDNWQEREGGVSVEDTVQVYREAFISMVDNYMIGMIVPVMLDPLPDYMLLCNGDNYSGDDFPELYAVIGDEWKLGDGTFVVPHLEGRFIIGAMPEEDGEGHIFPIDNTGGSYEHTLSVDEIPSHTHTENAHNHTTQPHNHSQVSHSHSIPAGNAAGSTANTVARTSITAGTVATDSLAPSINNTTVLVDNATATIQNTGGGQPHNNLPPWRAFRYAVIAR